jgi:alkylhydroperoxidase family enzyme
VEKGLTEAKISELDQTENHFTSRELAGLKFAEKLANDHNSIDDEFFMLLHKEFSDAEILELGMMIGQYLGFGRLLKVLNLEKI